MNLARRAFMVGALAGGSGVCALAAGIAPPGGPECRGLLIFDSRLPGGEWVSARAGEVFSRRMDLAKLNDRQWFRLASLDLRDVAFVGGCTAWQDFVVLRDLFRSRQWRPTVAETRVDVAGGRSLFLWRMG